MYLKIKDTYVHSSVRILSSSCYYFSQCTQGGQETRSVSFEDREMLMSFPRNWGLTIGAFPLVKVSPLYSGFYIFFIFLYFSSMPFKDILLQIILYFFFVSILFVGRPTHTAFLLKLSFKKATTGTHRPLATSHQPPATIL